MKIIEHGNITSPKLWWIGTKWKCPKCECVFKLERGDFSSNADVLTAKCPECGAGIRMKKPPRDDGSSIFESVFGPNTITDLFGTLRGGPEK
jgi:hypothetical protein